MPYESRPKPRTPCANAMRCRGEWFMSGDRMWVLAQSPQRQHNKNIRIQYIHNIYIIYIQIYIELKITGNTFGAWWNNWPARLDLKWRMADALHSNVNFGWFNTTLGFLLLLTFLFEITHTLRWPPKVHLPGFGVLARGWLHRWRWHAEFPKIEFQSFPV